MRCLRFVDCLESFPNIGKLIPLTCFVSHMTSPIAGSIMQIIATQFEVYLKEPPACLPASLSAGPALADDQ